MRWKGREGRQHARNASGFILDLYNMTLLLIARHRRFAGVDHPAKRSSKELSERCAGLPALVENLLSPVCRGAIELGDRDQLFAHAAFRRSGWNYSRSLPNAANPGCRGQEPRFAADADARVDFYLSCRKCLRAQVPGSSPLRSDARKKKPLAKR